jgi:DNA-binding XRE family transcriptional regulator
VGEASDVDRLLKFFRIQPKRLNQGFPCGQSAMRKSRDELLIDLAGIGRRIRELRGFETTQAEFARRIYVAQSYLSALERGEKEPGAGSLASPWIGC